jgi:hypothetical protein
MKSIIQEKKECFICKTTSNLESHHVFGGMNRKLSEIYGMKVWLCNYHHTGSHESVHINHDVMRCIRQYAQRVFENKYSHEMFMQVFGKNYL